MVATTLCAATLLIATADAASAWQTAHGNPDNSGAVDVRTAPAIKPSKTLNFTDHRIATGVVPVVAPDGTFYVGDLGGNLTSFSADGTPRWSRRLGNFESIITSPALGADGSVYVIGYAKVRDHRTSPVTVKHIAELHRFTAGGGWLWHVPLEAVASQRLDAGTPDILDFSAPTILRFGNSDVVMVATGRREALSETFLTAISGESGLVLARQKVTSFTAPDVTGGADWGFLCFWCSWYTFGTELEGPPPEERLPRGVKLAFPSPAISTPNNGGAQLVVMSDGYKKLTGYIFTGNAFDEAFRTSNHERHLTSTPLAWPNGPVMISSVADDLPEVKFVTPIPAGGSSDRHVPGPRSLAPPAALGDFRFAIVKSFGGVTIMSGAVVEKSIDLRGASIAAPAASRNHLFVSTAFALYTLNKANLQKEGEFSWGPRGGTSQPVIGPQGHVYAVAQDQLYIFPPSRLPDIPDIGTLPPITFD